MGGKRVHQMQGGYVDFRISFLELYPRERSMEGWGVITHQKQRLTANGGSIVLWMEQVQFDEQLAAVSGAGGRVGH
jgi:hypothetical protein